MAESVWKSYRMGGGDVHALRGLNDMIQAQSNLTTLQAGLQQVKSYPQLGIEDPPERGYFYL